MIAKGRFNYSNLMKPLKVGRLPTMSAEQKQLTSGYQTRLLNMLNANRPEGQRSSEAGQSEKEKMIDFLAMLQVISCIRTRFTILYHIFLLCLGRWVKVECETFHFHGHFYIHEILLYELRPNILDR